MSLLLAEGHADARLYVVAHLQSEVRIVRQRMAQRRKAEAVLMQLVISSVLSAQGGKALQRTIEGMDESD